MSGRRADASPTGERDASSEKLRVLLVEDDDVLNETVCTFLEMEGYAVECVSSLAEGLTSIVAREPDCLLLDLQLPDGSGERLLLQLDKRGLAPHTILVSASPAAARVAGRFGVPLVKKPFDLEELLSAIAMVLERDLRPRDAEP